MDNTTTTTTTTITNYKDLWRYISKDFGKAISCAKYYVKNPTPEAKAFWSGVLTVLEYEGVITRETGLSIWDEITE